MNDATKLFHGLKAARELILLIDKTALEQIGNVFIDFDAGTTREFTSSEYFDLAKHALDDAIDAIRQKMASESAEE